MTWDVVDHVAWYVYLLLFIVYTGLLAYGSTNVASGFYMKTLNSRKDSVSPGTSIKQKFQIAISFDDGPADNYTPAILDILAAHRVPAAFFCIGKNIAGRENLLNRIANEGHVIGNHSFSHHFWFDLYNAEKMTNDLDAMNLQVLQATGLKLRLFRPPYGVTNPNLARAVKKLGFLSIGWNVRSLDTMAKDPEQLLQKMLKSVKPGAIILFHDTCQATFLMLPAFIEAVHKRGINIVRLDKMLGVEAYA